MASDPGPALAGVRVVEVAAGISAVGAGLAGSLPGALLRDLGADVIRVQSSEACPLDAGVEYQRVWDRGKHLEVVDGKDVAATAAALARQADVVLIAGAEEWVERRRLTYSALERSNPRLVHVRVRPGYNALGPIPDVEMLVHARTGLLSQFEGHRPGPIFCDLSLASTGAALCATVGALAALYERESTGRGGWVETSLYDGMHALLPLLIGRVEFPTPSTASQWEGRGWDMALSFGCADGEYVQLWFGAKGAYQAFLAHIGDPPSDAGYAADILSGSLAERTTRWEKMFLTRERAWWVDDLAGRDFRCEPVLRPGQALREPHLAEVGLRVDVEDPDRGTITVLGPVVRVTPVPGGDFSVDPSARSADGQRLLAGVRLLDLSAFGAGPTGARILAELGADVVKVEPTSGDAHRGMDPSFASTHRGKRAVALNLKAPEAASVLHRLFQWADLVHHSSRIGLAERLGYDEETVRTVNPNVIYSHASGFGPFGPKARLPANDHLIQALSGIEAAAGGEGQPPTHLPAAPVDRTNGWLAACAMLAGLYARRRSGVPQSVTSILLGAGMTLKSGVFLVGDDSVEGPLLDDRQTGYGATYRLYQGSDGAWFALAILDEASWQAVRKIVAEPGVPDRPPPLRLRRGERQPAEEILEEAFARRPASVWVGELRRAGVAVEPVAEPDRVEFVAAILDDPVNHQLRRVVAFDWEPRGRLETLSLPVRFGPKPQPPPLSFIPRLGQHTDEVLARLGFDPAERAKLADDGIVATT